MVSGSKIARAVLLAGVIGGVAAACGGTNTSTTISGDGGISGSGGDGGSSGFTDSGSTGTITADSACAVGSSKAQQQPLDIYIMLDQSASMSDSVSGGGDKWAAVTGALKTFVGQSSLAGVGVGIQFFGVPPSGAGNCPDTCNTDADCGSSGGKCIPFLGQCENCLGGGGQGDSCTAADYAKPSVEIATLPGVASQIVTAINAHQPSTDTPTSAALQGAVDHAKAWSQAHAGHVTIALLATDGDPTECDTDLGNIDKIAAAGLSGTPKVLTFVIGVGKSLTALNDIAKAGGTNAAYIVDTTASNVNQQFLDALNKIRGTAVACQYQLPAPTNGGKLDYNTVNVQYTDSKGNTTILPKVASKADCSSDAAWYYDDNNNPTQIILCSSSCDTVSNDTNGEVRVLVGCATVVK